MKCTISILTILLMSLILFSSCVSNHFVPHAHNVPLFTEKKQTHLILAAGTSAIDLQYAHSFSNHVAAMINYKFQSKTPYCLEIGAGYFMPLGKKTVFEIYGGGGLGKYNYRGGNARGENLESAFTPFGGGPGSEYDVYIKSYQFFLQPNIGIKSSEKFSLALSTKVNYWLFPEYKYFLKESTSESYNNGNYNGSSTYVVTKNINLHNVNALTLEPALTIKTGGEKLTFMMQVGVYSTLLEPDLSPYDKFYNFFRLGLNWKIPKKNEQTLKKKNYKIVFF